MTEGKSHPEEVAAAVARMDEFVALGLVGQHAVAERLGLNVTDLTCLGHVLGAGDTPLTAGALAARAGLTTGAVTGVLGRLERAGYAHRQPDPGDRRRVRVVADPAAAARLAAAYGPFYERLHQLFAGYAPAELAVLTDWFGRAASLMRDSVAEIRSSPALTGG